MLNGKLPHGMVNCPSGVTGSTTQVRDTPNGIDVIVTAVDPTTQRKIVALAHGHEHMGNPRGGIVDTGQHAAAGTRGFCPVIHADTTISVDEVPGGAVIHVRPADPSKLDALRTATQARVKAITPPAS